jgi:hypothetical protein
MTDLSVEDIALLEAAEIDAWESLFAAAPPGLARELGLQTARFGPAMASVAVGADVGPFNRVLGIGLPGDEEGRSIDEAVAWFRSKRLRNFLVQIPPGPNARALAEKVRDKGLGLQPFRRSWTKFRRPPVPAHAAPTALRIARAGVAEAVDFGETAAVGFGMPPVLAGWLSALVGQPDWRCYVSYDGDSPVGVGAYWFGERTAWLGIGASRPEGRSRGSQSAILAQRVNDAIAEGAALLVTETGSAVEGEPQTSYSNILRAGFEIAYERRNWTGP